MAAGSVIAPAFGGKKRLIMNYKFDFSPGPWIIENGFDKDGNGQYFPSVIFSKKARYGKYKGVVINESHNQETRSIMANARLIAAAPELLAALIECVERVELDMGADNPRVKKAKELIQKVLG